MKLYIKLKNDGILYDFRITSFALRNGNMELNFEYYDDYEIFCDIASKKKCFICPSANEFENKLIISHDSLKNLNFEINTAYTMDIVNFNYKFTTLLEGEN